MAHHNFEFRTGFRHQLMELNDKAYDLAFQIAKSEAELQSLTQNSDGSSFCLIRFVSCTNLV